MNGVLLGRNIHKRGCLFVCVSYLFGNTICAILPVNETSFCKNLQKYMYLFRKYVSGLVYTYKHKYDSQNLHCYNDPF